MSSSSQVLVGGMHLSSVPGMGQTTQVANRDGLVEVTVDPAGVVTPCIITPSAYGGVHEGGKWMAFPMEHVPRAAIDSETVVVAWFAKNDWRVGVGDTPNDALANLLFQMQKAVKDGRAAIHRTEV